MDLARASLSFHLEQQTNIAAIDVLTLLNSNDDEAIVSPLWTGDAFYETNSGAVGLKDVDKFTQTLRADRELALHKVRHSIDEWIDSGRLKGAQSERALARTESQAPEAAFEAKSFWESSRISFVQSAFRVDRRRVVSDWSKPRLLPPDNTDFENAIWKAKRIVALVLSSDLRFRLAKCRYSKCKRPYFLLRNPNKVYVNGIFCSIEHNRAATAPARVIQRRHQFQARLIEWAADYARQHKTTVDNKLFKRKLAAHLNNKISKQKKPPRDCVSKNWVTKNWKGIQAKVSHQQASDS